MQRGCAETVADLTFSTSWACVWLCPLGGGPSMPSSSAAETSAFRKCWLVCTHCRACACLAGCSGTMACSSDEVQPVGCGQLAKIFLLSLSLSLSSFSSLVVQPTLCWALSLA